MKRLPHSKQIPQFGRYLFVGGISTVIGYACIFFCMYDLGWSPRTSNAIAYGIATFISYWANRVYTFRSGGRRIPEAIRFFIIFALAYSLNFVALSELISHGIHPAASQVLAGLVYVAVTFFANKMWVFKIGAIRSEGY